VTYPESAFRKGYNLFETDNLQAVQAEMDKAIDEYTQLVNEDGDNWKLLGKSALLHVTDLAEAKATGMMLAVVLIAKQLHAPLWLKAWKVEADAEV
jgi:hypothetical protein